MKTRQHGFAALITCAFLYFMMLVPAAFAVTGGDTVSQGGTYPLDGSNPGVITIATSDPVVFTGAGVDDDDKIENLFFDATGQTSDITFQDVFLSDTANTANVVDFAGSGNHLRFEGTVVIDYDFGYTTRNDAVIHVPVDASLTISGSGMYYQYNCTQGAGIGGVTGEMNGQIIFDMTGSAFIKGTRQGAVIGAGARANGTGTPGPIYFLSGEYNIISNSRGAAIGGAAGSNGGSEGTSVFIGDHACVNVNVDYSGAAIGGGGYAEGNDSSGGSVFFSGGSLRVYVDTNAANNLSGTYWKGFPLAKGINNVAMTAQRKDSTGAEDVYLCVVDTTGIEPNSDGEYVVQVDDEPFFTGRNHSYYFYFEDFDRNDGSGGTVPTTPENTIANWVYSVDPCFYFYLTADDHEISVNGVPFTATLNEDALDTPAECTGGVFTVEAAAAPVLYGDADKSGVVNANDALVVLRWSAGKIGEADIDLAAADVDGSGTVNANDALNILRYSAGKIDVLPVAG